MTAIPAEAHNALSVLRKRLTESLEAVYLHGSAVSGGLRAYSDVDLLAVIDRATVSESRRSLAADLMKISGRYPFDAAGRRPLELIVFLREDLLATPYPARGEFIYGEWLRHTYEAGDLPKPVHDPELTLVLAQARQEAKPLLGPAARELLPVIPQADIRRAIEDALPSLLATQDGDERNVLLTLARMWRTLTTGEFVPKDVAAEWVMEQLPSKHAVVLAGARDAYLGRGKGDLRDRWPGIRRTICVLRDCVAANIERASRVV